MKKIYTFAGQALVITALAIVPATAQSTSSGQQSGQPQSGTQSGQTTGSRTGGGPSDRTQDRERQKPAGLGEKVGADVPSQGTQTDQRGRTAAEGTRREATGTSSLRGPDRTFLVDALEGNHAEIQLAQLAQQKASSASVRELAQTILQHHEQASAKLTSIATEAEAASNTPTLKPQHKQLHDRLSKAEGAEFDRLYASEMVKEHQKDIQKYEKASTQLQHAGLKAYATETLPTLKKHLDMARDAQGGSPKTR
jgi:putative membrane protein